jgi:hypothetical protein
VDIPDETYRKLKAKAALEGSSVKELVLRVLDRELGSEKKRTRREPPIIGDGKGPKVNLTPEQIDEAMFG